MQTLHDLFDGFETEPLALIAATATPPKIWYESPWHDPTSDRLTILLGNNHHRSVTHHHVFSRVEVILLNYPQEHEDPFTGMTIFGGISQLVATLYQQEHQDHYENYRERHNTKRILTTAARIFANILTQQHHSRLTSDYLRPITQMLATEPGLAVHIPL